MGKYNIAVYAISKNEENNVSQFLNSCKDADLVVVTDTGSEDNTVQLLKDGGAIVFEAVIDPWRFDDARNIALANVPHNVDICISMDLDETLEGDWREEVERLFDEGVELIDYTFVELKDSSSSYRSKLHARHGWKWEKPIHEICIPTNNREVKRAQSDKVVIHHHRKEPADYLVPLNKFIEECPDYADSYIQRGAEYIQREMWKEAISDYNKYLEMTFGAEDEIVKSRRSYSYLAMAQALSNLKASNDCILEVLLRAVAEHPQSREAWVHLADGFMTIGNFPLAYGCSMTALGITERTVGAKIDMCWGDYPKEIASKSLGEILKRIGVNSFSGKGGVF